MLAIFADWKLPRLWSGLAGITGLLLPASTLPAQDLGEIAREIKARRMRVSGGWIGN